MKYNFDQFIDRQNTNALAHDGFENYLFGPSDNFPIINYEKNELIQMWVADMQFAAPPCAIQAMTQRLQHPLFGYTMNFDNQLYQAFNQWCIDKYGWSFKREEMFTSLGIIPALIGLVEYICHPHEKVLALTPSYAFFKYATERTERKFVTSKLIEKNDDYEIDFEDFEKRLKDPEVKLFMLCHPHNPTGRVWTQDELIRMGELCIANGVKIISDEIHCDLLRNGVQHRPLSKLFPNNPDIITCMAPSKTFNLAGLMMATVIIHDIQLQNLWKKKHFGLVNPLSLAAAIGVYRDGREWLDELKNYLDESFNVLDAFLKNNLPLARFKIPDSTYLAWIDFSAYFSDGVNLTRFFLEKSGVILEGAEMFVENGGQHVRLNLACPRAQLMQALERIRREILELDL